MRPCLKVPYCLGNQLLQTCRSKISAITLTSQIYGTTAVTEPDIAIMHH
jgi:hypothetical protein